MLTASAIQYYLIYTEQIHYTRDLRTTAQNTILNTPGIVIGSLIKLFSVTQCLYYPCTCLSAQRDLQRLIYIQYKFYTSYLSQKSLRNEFSFFHRQLLCNCLCSCGQCTRAKLRHLEGLNFTQFECHYWRPRKSRYKKSTCYRFDSSTSDCPPTKTISVKEGRYLWQTISTEKEWQAETRFEMCNLVSKSLGQRCPLRISSLPLRNIAMFYKIMTNKSNNLHQNS